MGYDAPVDNTMEFWKKNLYAIWAAQILAIMGFGSLGPIIPFYVQELGVTDPTQLKMWVGAIRTAGSIMLAIVAPIWGRLSDAYGRRLMLIRAYFGAMVMMVLMGLATHPWQLVVFRAFGGIFTGTVTAATVLVATTTPSKESGFSLGLLQSAIFLGGALGPMFGGIIADVVGFRPTFFITATFLLIAGLLSLFVIKEDFTPRPFQGGFWRNIMPDFTVVTRSRELLILIIIVGAVQMSFGVLSPILPLFIQSISPDTARIGSTTGLILGLRAAAGALAAVTLGKVSDKIGHKPLLILCLAGGALTHLPLIWVETPLQLLILRVAGGAFIGGTMPALNTLIVRKASRRNQGTIYGLRATVASAGMAMGPMVGAGLAAIWGYSAVFLAITGLLAGITVLISSAIKGRSNSSETDPVE